MWTPLSWQYRNPAEGKREFCEDWVVARTTYEEDDYDILLWLMFTVEFLMESEIIMLTGVLVSAVEVWGIMNLDAIIINYITFKEY